MDEHLEIHATVTDRWGGTETVYAGSVPAWAWPDHSAEWKRVRRTLILRIGHPTPGHGASRFTPRRR
jgi:hypothetical protein